MVGPCSSCGPYAQYCGHNNYSSMMWPGMQYPQTASSYVDDTDYAYSSPSSYASSSSPSVDCTLSLGTPSTRLSTSDANAKPTPHRNSVSSFCWDLLHPNKHSSNNSSSKPHRNGNANGNSNGNGTNNSNGDPLSARRCANCDTTSTPLWRNGPRGPKSLCNACGIRFKKEERRAAAASSTAAGHHVSTPAMMDPHGGGYYNGGSWAHQYAQAAPQKMQYFGAPNEFRFMEDDRGSDGGIQFLSWLTHDRPSGLVHDFTR